MYKKKKGTDSSDGFAANSTAPITPLATPDNLSSNSDGKVTNSAADKQMGGAESSLQSKATQSITEPYTITPTSYTNKKGKTSDVHLVKFNRELTAEEKAALDTFARALEPVPVKRNNLSRAELREVYNNLPAVEKDGRDIEFYRSAFKKIYKDGGLFGQVVPVLDEILEKSVLAYSEKDNLGGMVRPDGTIHKEHTNTLTFDNYVGKVNIDGVGHYVRMTIQHDKGNRNGMHSCFVTEVEIYENAGIQATGTENSRVKPYYSGIVDAKLQQFFERASSEALELDKADRVRELPALNWLLQN